MTGRPSSRPSPTCTPAAPAGRPNSSARASGTNRISSAFTKMPSRGAPTSSSSSRSPAAIPRASGSTERTLDPPDATSDLAGVPLLDEDYLILSTIHSAKGQEWKSVFVLNVVDGCIPVRSCHRHLDRDRGGTPLALRRDDTCQGRVCTSSSRSASSRTARVRRETGTFTPRGHASFRTVC